MNGISYTYSVVRYLHDPATGETLNVGVVLWAPSVRYLAARFEHRYERLSNTFVDFKGEHYKRSLRQFETALDNLSGDRVPTLLPLTEQPETVAGFIAQIWPDEGLSFISGPVLAGITDDPAQALSEIFDRMVASQYAGHRKEKRDDEEVWTVYHAPLVRERVTKKLRPWTLETELVTLKFQHAFRNERWQVLEPVSLDYIKAESIQRRATSLLGNVDAISDYPQLSRLSILLGRPQNEKYQKHYIKAKNILHKMPVKHDLVEEDEAEDFAKELADYMRSHGLIDD
jgi:hypothetical protein